MKNNSKSINASWVVLSTLACFFSWTTRAQTEMDSKRTKWEAIRMTPEFSALNIPSGTHIESFQVIEDSRICYSSADYDSAAAYCGAIIIAKLSTGAEIKYSMRTSARQSGHSDFDGIRVLSFLTFNAFEKVFEASQKVNLEYQANQDLNSKVEALGFDFRQQR